MGTNYYLTLKPPCECCGREYEPIHIGKSSAGWYFSLKVHPELGINRLEDYIKMWSDERATIKDNYGQTVNKLDMLQTITNRSRSNNLSPFGDRFMEVNHAETGINNLLRFKVDGNRCIGHADYGTWSYITGDFS